MIRIGDQIPLQLQLFDGATGKFPQAVVKDAAGTAISGSPFDLAHVANGHYSSLTAVMPSTAFVTIQYLVYTDAGHTTLDTNYSIELELQEQENSLITSGYTAPDNTSITAIKAKTDNLPADPASNTQVNTRAPASTALDNTVWTGAKAAFVDVAISSRNAIAPDNATIAAIAGYVDTEVAAIKAKTDNLPADPASNTQVNTRASQASVDAIAGYVDTEVAAIKAKTDNLPSDPADNSDILTAISLIPVSSAPTVGQIADAVWDEALAGHVSAGSTGEKLNQGATVNVQDIVDGVWDEPIASHLDVGSTGEKLNSGGTGGGGGSSSDAVFGVVETDEGEIIGTVE